MTSLQTLRAALLPLACSIFAATAVADGISVKPIDDAATAKECSACHMLYPAGLLPARSWARLMNGLGDHFGDNATLDDALRTRITEYLSANAGDTGGRGNKMVRDIPSDASPLRITQFPYFLRKHDKKGRIAPETLKRRGARSPSDCKACHEQAEKGFFDDD